MLSDSLNPILKKNWVVTLILGAESGFEIAYIIKDPNKSNTQKYFRHSNVKRYELALLRSGYYIYFGRLFFKSLGPQSHKRTSFDRKNHTPQFVQFVGYKYDAVG